jgi:GTP diphosphokinase / guanosine-3',5'-bis(diphosphate) 3'-diphosphatase
MAQIKELLGQVKFLNPQKIELITRAYNFAEKAHKGIKRYSGEPYFNHLIETAKILAELGMGKSTIAAGLLHDVIEDANVTPEEVEKKFSRKIRFLVEGVTKLGKIRYSGEERHAESLRKFFVAMSQDIRVLIIKLADRLHNMRTLEHVPEEKRYRIAMETMEIYVPLAYRLGIRKIKREMEDLAFKYIEPEKYEELRKILKEKVAEKEKELEKFRKVLLKELANENIKEVTTDYRQKSIYSIHKKITMRHKDIDKIFDILALRINVNTVTDCYRVLGIIHGLWRPLPGRIKDYIAFQKPNGYQSLHTTVFTGDGNILEIQIRTYAMHEQAEYGFASHAAYKEGTPWNDPNIAWFKQFFPGPGNTEINPQVDIDEERVSHIPRWIKELVDVQAYVTAPGEFLANLKTDFFEDRMFIFDINGNVIDLPRGSTPIDFAYEDDPDTGDFFHGARVNGKFVQQNTQLENGDIVEVITKKTPQVNEKWLEYCKTASAKKHIRESLKDMQEKTILPAVRKSPSSKMKIKG